MIGSWPVRRLLVTGYGTPHLQRHIDYALSAGVEVLQVGRAPIYRGPLPSRYAFSPLAEANAGAVKAMRFDTNEYRAALTAESERLHAIARAFGPDLAHAVGLDFTADVCMRAGLKPLVVSALGYLGYLVSPNDPGLDARDQALLVGAAALIVESPMLVERCRAVAPVGLPIFELSVGLDTRRFRPATTQERTAWRRALHLPSDATVILSPRGWKPSYNHHQVLAAFAAALPDLPAPAYLLFVQMSRSAIAQRALDYYAQVQAQANTLGIADQVRWLPAFPAVGMAMLYNVADVVISYCTPDTFPVTVLEALACARPVIVPRLPTFRDSVIERWCTLVAPNDPPALAAALTELVRQAPDQERLLAARAAVAAVYDAPVVMEKIGAIYAAALQAGEQTYAH